MQIRLKEARIKNRISIRELANRSGVSKGSIEKMEGPSPNPRVITVCKVAHALGLRAADLIDDDDG